MDLLKVFYLGGLAVIIPLVLEERFGFNLSRSLGMEGDRMQPLEIARDPFFTLLWPFCLPAWRLYTRSDQKRATREER
jgi:hypothetical protein